MSATSLFTEEAEDVSKFFWIVQYDQLYTLAPGRTSGSETCIKLVHLTRD